MKTKILLLAALLLSVFIIFGTACKSQAPLRHPKGVIIESKPASKKAPGQIKKLDGEKSAKSYAPGQNKKHKKRK